MQIAVTDIQSWNDAVTGDRSLYAKSSKAMANVDSVEKVFDRYEVTFLHGLLDPSDPFYPKTSDLKVMRDDTIASVICARRILDRATFTSEITDNMGLMVANSNFIDNGVLEFETIARAIAELQKSNIAEEKNRSLGAGVSPLLPLRTLTNGTESFIAQYTQIKGENTTYGSTCLATGHAAMDACALIELGVTQVSMVGGSHYANVFSFLNQYLLLDATVGYKESTAASYFLLESLEHAKKLGRKVLALIEDIQFNHWSNASEDLDLVIVGGAFTPVESENQIRKCVEQYKTKTLSIFSVTGSLGCAELGFLLSIATQELSSLRSAIIYLEDAYGEFLTMKVKKP
jgi:hypothetical protein